MRRGPEHVRRRGRARQPLRRRPWNALQRGGRLRRPAAAARTPRRRRSCPGSTQPARFICDSSGTTAVRSPRCRATSSGGCSTAAHELGYEPMMGFEPEFYLLDRSTRSPSSRVPHLQHGPEHVRPVHPASWSTSCTPSASASSPRTASTQARSGRSTSSRRPAWPGPTAPSPSRMRSRSSPT